MYRKDELSFSKYDLIWIETWKSNLWHFEHFYWCLLKREKKKKKIVPVQREKTEKNWEQFHIKFFIKTVVSKSEWIL